MKKNSIASSIFVHKKTRESLKEKHKMEWWTVNRLARHEIEHGKTLIFLSN